MNSLTSASIPVHKLTTAQRLGIVAIVLIRAGFFSFFIFSFDHLIGLGTSPFALSMGALLGTIVASTLAFTRLKLAGFILCLGLPYAILRLLLYPSYFFPEIFGKDIFTPYLWLLHLNFFYLVLGLSAISSWAFWRYRSTVTIEILLLSASVIYLLSGHRDFHFDNPKVISSLAWLAHVEHLRMIILLGALLISIILLYSYVSSLPLLNSVRPALNKGQKIALERSRPNALVATILLGLIVAIISLVSQWLYGRYNLESLSRTANGVGEEHGQGVSPLGFHSALGSTNQPAALVRLEGDYSENPFSPMMYLRESALSEMQGNQIVGAGADFDKDVNGTSPNESYIGKEDIELLSRTPVSQSVYLLADHKMAFGLDYPLSISRLKNPNPSRFKAAYRVYSMAPAFKLSDLSQAQVGDPRWSEAVKEHYLKTHADVRYASLAEKLAKGFTSPIEKAFAITRYLSESTIYTLAPNHDEKPGEDPVAPYLFGDHRGYCVHFAHAMVYLFRSLGIPARIGTGYLTDLSQAKDGHILLRMSDRHAWAEIYVTGKGWVPFDIEPAQVESHAETQVDMSTLEELMDLLTPGDEVLPEQTLSDEPNVTQPAFYTRAQLKHVVLIFLILLASMLSFKALLRYGYLLPGNRKAKLRRSYVALASSLHDLGLPRLEGETRYEYSQRLKAFFGSDAHSLGELVTYSHYAPAETGLASFDEIQARRLKDFNSLRTLPWWRRGLALLNPSSVFTSLLGARW